MKKYTIILLLACVSLGAYAQKGMNGIGVNLGMRYDLYFSSAMFAADIKYQYNITNWYRIEPFISFDTFEKGTSFLAGLNNQFFFTNDLYRVRPYFSVGFAYGAMVSEYEERIRYDNYEYTPCVFNHFLIIPSAGLDIRASYRSSFQIEFSYIMNPIDKNYIGGDYYDDAHYFSEYGFQLKVGYTFNF